jgi:hypothetical protein
VDEVAKLRPWALPASSITSEVLWVKFPGMKWQELRPRALPVSMLCSEVLSCDDWTQLLCRWDSWLIAELAHWDGCGSVGCILAADAMDLSRLSFLIVLSWTKQPLRTPCKMAGSSKVWPSVLWSTLKNPRHYVEVGCHG